MSRQRNKSMTALAGEYLVAGQLSMRGLVASLTLKNFPQFDVLVMDPETKQQACIQVKTVNIPMKPNMKAGAYFLPEAVEHFVATPFVFVTINPELAVSYYILPGERVEEISERGRQEWIRLSRERGKTPSEKQPRMIGLGHLANFENRWENIGLPCLQTPIPPAPDAVVVESA